MYSGESRLCVCVSICGLMATQLQDPDVTWGNGRGCVLVVYYWADLQSVHGLRCYDNTARKRNVSECLYSLVCLVSFCLRLQRVLDLKLSLVGEQRLSRKS